MALWLKIVAVVSCWLCAHVAFGQRTWYFSSSQGDDRNDGRTPATALRSVEMLQRLFDGWWVGGDTLRRGDTIALLRGDTFRVVYGRSGGHLAYGIRLFWGVATQPGLPIVITAYGPSNGQPPLITGTWRLSDSARAIIMGPDGIVKVAKPFGSHRDVVPLRIFHKGTPLPLARFPNDTMLVILGFRTARDLLHADTIITRGLDNVMPSSVGGAVIWAPTVADFVWGCSKVVGLSKDTLLTLRWYEFPPERGARFYLEGKREFLDKPGEWYYDEQTDTLYLWPPALPFQPHEYEVMLVGVDHVDRTKIHRSRGLELGVSYDTLPDFPVQSIIIENLRFSWLVEGILLLGVKDITIRNCEFTESFRGIWNFLGENLLIRNNRFHDICHEAIGVHGRPPRDGVDPRRSMTRRAYVEHNTIRRTGLGRRWAWQTLQIDSARFWLDDRGIALTTNIDSVIARYNTIDGVGHVGIAAYLTHLEQWDRGYQGTLPFVIERNLITNFCMQSSDCGGILTIFYCRNGVVRNNILVKGANSDKSHHAYIMRPRAMGLYADAWPHDMLWEGNTVIGTDVGCTIYYGGGAVKNVRIERNTVYGCRIVGAETVTANGDVEECVARGNVFFGPMHGAGAVAAQDHYRNGKSDRFAVVDENWYVLPTYAPAYVQWTEEGKDFVYGFGQMRRRTSYEQSPLSRWLEWVQLRAWDTARVKRGLIRNSGLDRAPVPIWPFGGVRMEWVASSPLGVPARMVWCPDSVRDSWNGFFMVMDEPFYTAVTETSAVYRWSLGWASNRQKEYWSVWWPRTIHPNTGDTIIIPYHFALPVRRAYRGDTLHVYYQPRFRQFWTMPHVVMEPGDTVWLSYYNVEEIDPQTVPSFEELFPIFINPSDTVRTVELPRGWVYMTLDSQVVWGRVQVAPWGSRILMRVRYDRTLSEDQEEMPLQRWAVVYPNPVEELLTVLLPERGTVKVVSVDGREVYSSVVEGQAVVPMSGLAAGVYLVHIQYQGGHRETVKVAHVGTTPR